MNPANLLICERKPRGLVVGSRNQLGINGIRIGTWRKLHEYHGWHPAAAHNSVTKAQLFPLEVLAALGVSFAALIFFLLHVRKKNLAKNLELKAEDVWPQIQDAGFDFSCLLYGIWQDFSATQRGMIVRDCGNREVGKIMYRAGRRQGWLAVETSDGNFEADVLPTLRQSVSLRAARDGSSSICDFSRLPGGAFRFEVKSVGILESKAPRGFHLAPVFEYALNGKRTGASRHIGRWIDRGRMVVLPEEVPLPVRLFVLAMQAERL